MKKIFLSSLLFVMLISMSFENSNAQPCPTGYTESTATFTYSNGSTTCTYIIDFCFQCSPGSGPMKVNLNWFSTSDATCFNLMMANFDDFIVKAKNYILENHTAILCGGTLPCNQGYKPVYVYTPRCWQIYNDCSQYILRACDDVYFCKSTYNTCLDYNYSPPRLVQIKVGGDSEIGGTPPCSAGTPPLPPCYSFSPCFLLYSCE
jgi:hypothetical protein